MKEEILELIDKNDVISFDVFDTLLLRNVYKPTDIFRILAKIALNEYNIDNFYDIRISSEKESRTEDNNGECHYDDIYRIIGNKIKDKKIVKKLKEEELKLEEKFLIANPFFKEIYEYCLSKNKKILLISDMYLDEKFLKKQLKRCGYNSEYTLYLSNVYRKKKGDSSLFEVAFSEEKIDKNYWLHIGDNRNSDYIVPINFGINAYLYKGVYSHINVEDYSIFESIILGIQNNYLYNGLKIDYWDAFGVKNVSPIYFGFTKWLYEFTKNSDNLFFIARDGYIIEKIYHLFDKEENVYTNYLYCSRNSFVIPSLYVLPEEDMLDIINPMFQPNTEVELKKLLLICGINLDDFDIEIIRNFDFKSLNDLVCVNNFNNAKKLLLYLSDNIKSGLKEKYDLVQAYLKQEGVDNYSSINIMDIGWGGSIQNSIDLFLNKPTHGYYFGTIDVNKRKNFCKKYGYFFDFGEPSSNKKEILDNVMMYEFIFSAPHGSTIGYEKKNNRVIPILDDNKEYNEIVAKFQKTAIDIIKKYLEYMIYFDYVSKEFCISFYKKFIEERKFEDVVNFSKLSSDCIIGNNLKFKYINQIDNNVIMDNNKFLETTKASLWPYTFICNGDNFNSNDYYLYKSRLFTLFYNLVPLSHMKLYLDYGDGFNERNTTFVSVTQIGNMYKFKYYFDLEKEVYALRIDPIDNRKIILRNLHINSEFGDVKFVIPHKKYILSRINNYVYINSIDPKIIIHDVVDLKYIEFEAEIELV